jgi:hemerythrin
VIDGTLGQFVEHSGKHFLAEESMMDQHQYPKAMEYKALHEAMLKDVLAFKESYNTGGNTESITHSHWKKWNRDNPGG